MSSQRERPRRQRCSKCAERSLHRVVMTGRVGFSSMIALLRSAMRRWRLYPRSSACCSAEGWLGSLLRQLKSALDTWMLSSLVWLIRTAQPINN